MAEKKLENCADTKYSKERTQLFQIYLYVMKKGKSEGNEFEKKLFIYDAVGLSVAEMVDYISRLLSNKDLKEDEKKELQGVKETVRSYNSETKKFLNLSLYKKLKSNLSIPPNYKYLFEVCESNQKETPSTFNAFWKKAEIQFIGDKNNK